MRALIPALGTYSGVEAYLVSFGKKANIVDRNGTKIIILKAGLLDYLLPFLPILKISLAVKKINPDYINVQGTNLSPYLLYAQVAFPQSRKSITVHSSWSWELAERGSVYPGSLLHKVLMKMEGTFLRRFNPIFVVTPNLLRMFPSAVLLERPVGIQIKETSEESSQPSEKLSTLKIAHLPTRRSMKGTEDIVKGIGCVVREGAPVQLTIVSNVTHEEALEIIRESDIVVDQINGKIGMYGIVSIESMAFGKTTICYLDREYRCMYPLEIPIVSPENATAESLADCIRTVLSESDEIRQSRSRAAIDYVRRVHSPRVVAERLIQSLQDR